MIAKVLDREVHLERFSINNSLIFALKSMSGDKENDIVTYFYELGIKLFNDAVSKKKVPNRVQRVIKTFYKDTQLQVKFEVSSGYLQTQGPYDTLTRHVGLHMSLTYPNDVRTLSGKDIETMFAEAGLGLGDGQVTTVNKPEEKLYRCLRKK